MTHKEKFSYIDWQRDMTSLEYQKLILQYVSRTFALTIPQLPERLQDVIANAYLLCRITDTIEDEALLPPDVKLELHNDFIKVIKGAKDPSEFAVYLTTKLSSKTPPPEQNLVANIPRVIEVARSFSNNQINIVRRYVTSMNQGMPWFSQNSSSGGLQNQKQLDKYCYFVAGVVGEMLTELFCDYSPKIAAKKSEMMWLGVSFGQGLQMTNVLLDVWDDKKRNVCWLPRDVFLQSGFELKQLSALQHDAAFRAGMKVLIGTAHSHLKNALSYALLIPKEEVGIRKFCLWAIKLAIYSLRNINNNLNFTDRNQVKVSRRTVKYIIAKTNFFCKRDKFLMSWFKKVSKDLPTTLLAHDWEPLELRKLPNAMASNDSELKVPKATGKSKMSLYPINLGLQE